MATAPGFEIGRGYILTYTKLDKKAIEKTSVEAMKVAGKKAGETFSNQFNSQLKTDLKTTKAVATTIGQSLGATAGAIAGSQFSKFFQSGIQDNSSPVVTAAEKLGKQAAKSMAAQIVDGYEAAISAKFKKLGDKASSMFDSVAEKSKKAGNSLLNGLTGGNGDRTKNFFGNLFGKIDMFGKVGGEIGSRLMAGIGSALSAGGPYVAGAAALLAAGFAAEFGAVLVPLIGGVIGAALISNVAIVGIAAGIKGAAQSPKVKDAWKGFADGAQAMFQEATASFVAPVTKSIGLFQKELKPIGKDLNDVFLNLAPSIEKLAGNAAGFVKGLLGGFKDISAIARPFIERLGSGVQQLGENVGRMLSEFSKNKEAVAGAYAAFDLFIKAAANGLPYLIKAVELLSQGFFKMIGHVTGVLKAFASGARALGLDQLADGLDGAANGMQSLMTSSANATTNLGGLTTGMSANTIATDANTTALGRNLEAQTKVLNLNLSAAQAKVNQAKTESEFNKFLAENTRGWDLNTQAGQKNQEQLYSYISTQSQNIETQKKAIAETQGVAAANEYAKNEYQKLNDKVVQAGIDMGLTAGQAQDLANKTLAIPNDKNLNFTTSGYESVDQKLRNLEARIISLSTGGKVSLADAHTELNRDDAMARRGGFNPVKKARGGYVMGPGTGTSDSIPALLSNREYVISADMVQKYGKTFFDSLNQGYYGREAVAKYAKGGSVNVPVDVSRTKLPDISKFLTDVVSGGPMGGSSVGGWAAMWNALKAAVPSARLYSAYRPGDRTPYGNTSYHSSGRAIDVNPSQANMNFIHDKYGKNTKELIWGGDYRRNILNGRYYKYDDFLLRQHGPYQGRSWGNDHLHWAMDNSGVMPPNSTTMVTNATSAREYAMTEDKLMDITRGTIIINADITNIRDIEALQTLVDSVNSSQSKRVL